MAAAASSSAANTGQKRARSSWEVDVSLEELVSWDVLEQFMQDMPTAPEAEPALGQTSMDPGAGVCAPQYRHQQGAGPSTPTVMGGGASASMHGAFASGSDSGRSAAGPSSVGTPPASSSAMVAAPPMGQYNAASLAQSLYSGWQAQAQGNAVGVMAVQPQQPNMLGVSWGAELLPSTLGDEGQSGSVGSPTDQGGFDGMGESTVSGGRPVHKTRFVWTAELHRRFEAAVNTLGIDHAKPQVGGASRARARVSCTLDGPWLWDGSGRWEMGWWRLGSGAARGLARCSC